VLSVLDGMGDTVSKRIIKVLQSEGEVKQ